MGYRYPTGYGSGLPGGYAHRQSYTMVNGPIPAGLVIDHLCGFKACVNPSHLEAVTQKENVRRSPLSNGNKTVCPSGHPYSEENTYWSGGSRKCATCVKARQRRYNAIGPLYLRRSDS